MNQVARTPLVVKHERAEAIPATSAAGDGAPDPRLVEAQVKAIVGEMLGPLVNDSREVAGAGKAAANCEPRIR